MLQKVTKYDIINEKRKNMSTFPLANDVLIQTYKKLINDGVIGAGVRTSPMNTQITDFAGRSPFVTVFGEQVVGSRQNNINIPFIRNNGNIGDTEYMKTTVFTSSGTGAQSHSNETAKVESGVGVGTAVLRSKSINRYITGHGNEVFHTMVFSEPESGVDSGVGYGDKDSDFLGFGYNGTVFGIWLVLRGVRTHIPQSSWNVNKLNANGLTPNNFVLNPQKENIMGSSFGWLGVADILFYVNTSKDDWVLVHRHQTANIDDKPHMSDPSRPISEWIERTAGSGANVTVGTSSWYGGTVGNRATGTGADKTPLISRAGVSVPSSTETVLLSIRNKTTFAGKPNTVRLRYGTVTLVADGNKSVDIKVYKNGVSRAVGTWGDFDTNLSVSEINTDSPLSLTSVNPIPTVTKINEQIGSTALSKQGSVRINLFESDIVIDANPDDIITITAESTNATVIDVQLRWIEEF